MTKCSISWSCWAVKRSAGSASWLNALAASDGGTIVFWAAGKIRRVDVATGESSVIPVRVQAEKQVREALRFAVEVVKAVNEIDDRVGRDVVKQPVDREVAAERVVLDAAPLVVVGDQTVFIDAAVRRRGPEGARLDDLRAEEHVRELEAAPDDSRIAEGLADRLRRRAR